MRCAALPYPPATVTARGGAVRERSRAQPPRAAHDINARVAASSCSALTSGVTSYNARAWRIPPPTHPRLGQHARARQFAMLAGRASSGPVGKVRRPRGLPHQDEGLRGELGPLPPSSAATPTTQSLAAATAAAASAAPTPGGHQAPGRSRGGRTGHHGVVSHGPQVGISLRLALPPMRPIPASGPGEVL